MVQKKWFNFFLCIILIFTVAPLRAEEPTQKNVIDVSDLDIGSEAAILMDADTKTILYEKNIHEKLYPASITKLMTALLAIENLSPEETITFSNEAVNSIEFGSNHLWMVEGEQITVDEALHGLLLESANEVANGLGEAVSGSISGFAQRMTERAKELGAQNTNFINPNGLHDDAHYTTAYDMALIASYLTHEDYFLKLMKDTKYQIPPTNKNKETRYLAQQHHMINPVRDPKVFREDVIGGKTGYTNEARQTLVTMARQGDTTLVVVILKAEKSNVYRDTNALLDYGFSAYSSQILHTADEMLKTLPIYSVKSGQSYLAANCGISLKENAKVLLNHLISKEDIVPSFHLPDALALDTKEGDVVGSVDFVLDSKILLTSELVVSKIEMQPEPEFTIVQKVFMLSPLYLGLITVAVVLILLFIILIIRHHRKKSRYGRYKKMFK